MTRPRRSVSYPPATDWDPPVVSEVLVGAARIAAAFRGDR